MKIKLALLLRADSQSAVAPISNRQRVGGFRPVRVGNPRSSRFGNLRAAGCRRATALCLALALVVSTLSTSVHAQPSSFPRADFWVPDGPVNAIVETNGVVYIGGLFDYVSPISETGDAFDAVSGSALPGFPKFNGAIKAIQRDNAGGWFVGGLFTSVNGFPVTNLAHVSADKTLDTSWTPNPDGAVLALAVSEAMLYVGGTFLNIGGQAHSLLAALDPATGAVLSWRADCTTQFPKPSVNALVLSGQTLYVGGYFSFINGVEREHIGAVDASTGQVTSWFPNGYTGAQAGSRIDALAISENILFVGGTFTSIGGLQTIGPIRNYIAALDVSKDLTNSVLPWNPNANGPVASIAVSCDTVYVSGSFTSIDGTNRNRVAALDMITGRATVWDPNANGDVLSVMLAGNTLYAGGKFTQIGGQPREFVAALDIATGQATLWNPRADFGVAGLTVSGSTIVAGGALGPGGKLRKNVAAFSARTGKPLDWSPQVTGSTIINGFPYQGVYALAASSSMVYLGGPFTAVDGQPRNRVAAVNAVTGAVTAWNPNANGVVEALTVCSNLVYAGGRFTMNGGQSRTNLAALDASTGTAASWNPRANDKVKALLCLGNTIYAAGLFTQIGTSPRNRLAAINASTGVAAAWNPNVNDQISALSSSGNILYLGGHFFSVGGVTRNRLAGVDLTGGAANCWDPNAQFGGRSAAVNTVAALGNTVFVGGAFSSVGGQPRNNLAELSTNCPGNATTWNPNLDSPVNAVLASGGLVFAGGQFQNVGGQYHPFFAVFPPEGAPRITLQPLSQQVGVGATVTFAAQAVGQPPLSFQWQFNGTNLPGATSSNLVLSTVQITNPGDYALVVTNALGLVQSRPATLTVIQPITIVTQPASQTVSPGTTVTLSVVAIGSPPPIYQWRLNGMNIPGAIRATFTITNAQPTNGGSYQVVVANIGGALSSEVAEVVVSSPALAFEDNFAARGSLSGSAGLGSGSNVGASREVGENKHAGKPGSNSVWVRWTAPASGIATFSTRGSSFDTLLAIYTGTTVSALTPVASDEDRGGFLTSQASFNAVAGTEYGVVVDGFAGASGNIVLKWSLDTSTVPFPRILSQPLSLTKSNGASATFSVTVFSPTPETYQWFRECNAIAGATNDTLTISNVRPSDVGSYRVVVMNASSRAAESVAAFLEIGPDPNVLSEDKLEDLLAQAAAGGGGGLVRLAGSLPGGFVSVAVGSIDSQTVNNSGGGIQLGETHHCDVLGGASRWIGLRPEADGRMIIDTLGSAIDTVLAVYWPPTNLIYLSSVWVACDNNGASDGIRSLVRFNATRSRDYLVVVDGVNGATGRVSINWKLGLPPALVSSPPTNLAVRRGGSVTLRANATNAIPSPFYQWFLNQGLLLNETNATLHLSNVQIQHAGTYSVMSSNFAGVVFETNAVLTVEVPLELISLGMGPDGYYGLRVDGEAGQGFVLQATTNLTDSTRIDWTPLLTNQITEGPLHFLDTDAPRYRKRFYRALTWP